LSAKAALVQKEESELYKVTQQKQRLEQDLLRAKSRVVKSCIQNRARIHREAIREVYETERQTMGQPASERPLQVFSVSANAFFHFIEGEEQEAYYKGFSAKADTGIPDLRDALVAITWGSRLQNAQLFNEDVQRFVTRTKLWIVDSSSEYKMTDGERAIVEKRMEAEVKKLEQVRFSIINMNRVFE
jgi:hypothetical protein